MTTRRLLIAAVILLVALALGAVALIARYQGGDGGEQAEAIDIGGPFTMAAADDGRTVTEQDLLGHPSLIFFGFTFCPDVCPSTLAEAAGWLDALGPDGEAIQVYFVTVDPARDTPEMLAEYVGHFSPRFTALHGSHDQLAEMAASYKVYYKRIDMGEGEYLMDHTAAVYLMDDEGRFFDAITYQATSEDALAKLRRLLAAS